MVGCRLALRVSTDNVKAQVRAFLATKKRLIHQLSLDQRRYRWSEALEPDLSGDATHQDLAALDTPSLIQLGLVSFANRPGRPQHGVSDAIPRWRDRRVCAVRV